MHNEGATSKQKDTSTFQLEELNSNADLISRALGIEHELDI